ncbi:hypothetical protein M011DRAFT_136690 [Sporormia fimetaria CBS 119925]|uniref:Uncharacterized protein n=1 Tax=Sporormia fimetaria CBS 119925 TaxID=1340428 RepID=A0A6A6V6V2_9PLEO|nr:hypothetical protein M011DRAFT_136690 [Sporormia fimetaria CBS 119925]
MSSTSLPISASRFAAALHDLPLSSLHAKIHELENSITHLQKSNTELESFVRENDDRDCYEALIENKDVIKRMEERVELVKKEITEDRGLPLGEAEGGKVNGAATVSQEEETELQDGQGEAPHQEQALPQQQDLQSQHPSQVQAPPSSHARDVDPNIPPNDSEGVYL